jgi:acyl-CoA thioester hydrolase
VNDQPTAAADDRPRKPAPKLADYPHRIADNIRFGDLDPQGHVNQAMFLTYFENGRVAMFRTPDLGIGVPGLTYVLVRFEVDYIKELLWPGSIDIGTGVAEFGRSSFKVVQAIFRDGAVAAIGKATLVCMDKTTRKSAPLSQASIDSLSKWKIADG